MAGLGGDGDLILKSPSQKGPWPRVGPQATEEESQVPSSRGFSGLLSTSLERVRGRGGECSSLPPLSISPSGEVVPLPPPGTSPFLLHPQMQKAR